MQPALIIGAGPAGLATAAALKRLGVEFQLLDESAVVGGAYRRMWDGLILASPTRFLELPGYPLSAASEHITAGEYHDYLSQYADHFGLRAEEGNVTGMNRLADGFRVTMSDGQCREARSLVVASGSFAHPRMPFTFLGLDRSKCDLMHSQDWQGAEPFVGKRVLVIGSAISGVEIAEACARAGVDVLVSVRNGKAKPVSPRLLGRHVLDFVRWVERLPRWIFGQWCRRGLHAPGFDQGYREFRKQGAITELGPVQSVEDSTVMFADGHREMVNVIVCATGYEHRIPFLPQIVAREEGGHPKTKGNESITWPGLFFIGFPCARGIDSQYIRGIARDAPRMAKQIRARCSVPVATKPADAQPSPTESRP